MGRYLNHSIKESARASLTGVRRVTQGPLKLRLEAGGQSPVMSGQIWAQGEVTVPSFRLKISEIREASPVICRAIKKLARA